MPLLPYRLQWASILSTYYHFLAIKKSRKICKPVTICVSVIRRMHSASASSATAPARPISSSIDWSDEEPYKTRYFWIRNSSHIATQYSTHLVVFVLAGRPSLNKPKAPSLQIQSGRIWHDYSSSKYALIDRVGFLTSGHTFRISICIYNIQWTVNS